MSKNIHKIIIRLTDGFLYCFIGPFGVLYIIPQFLLNASNIKSRSGFGIPALETVGIILMWFGAALAVWSSMIMLLWGKGTPLVTSAPQKIVHRNIYAYVRHPMMWSLLIVTLGESLMYGNIILIFWLIALSRIIYLFVVKYEEPQLERRFGKSWRKYCQKVPRFIPRFNKKCNS